MSGLSSFLKIQCPNEVAITCKQPSFVIMWCQKCDSCPSYHVFEWAGKKNREKRWANNPT